MAEILFLPPASLPDLYPVLNVLLSASIFGLSWIWSIKRLVEISWAMGPLGSSVQPTRSDRKTLELPGTRVQQQEN
jgi:alpha-1,3-glucosyltransferase